MNKVILMGRLTADPVLNQTPSGISSCRFRIAVDRPFKNQNGTYDADFISCTAWRQTAEFICRYFKKGNMIMVEGNLRSNNYQDKKHPDVTHYTFEVMVDNVEFTGEKIMNSGNNNFQQNNGYNNGYNNNGYNNNGGYNNNNNGYNNNNNGYNGYSNNNNNFQTAPEQQTPPPPPPPQNIPNNESMSYGNVAEYEDIIGDNDVPF